MSKKRIIFLGDNIPTGCYLLRIQLAQDRYIQFGRFNNGDAVFLPKGEYLYIGSAQGLTGSSSLGARLMRHSSRSNGSQPHAIRKALITRLYDVGIKAKVPRDKTCHWHIDYLLDIHEAEIIGIIILRSFENLEKKIAKELAGFRETGTVAKGLGASDHPGETHLYNIQANGEWWEKLPNFVLKISNPGDGIAKI